MVQINFAQKQINAKIVYYGPGMSGKTTNLEVVHKRAPESNRGDLTSISTDGDRTLFFDYMPLDLGTIAGMRTSFQMYTVPGQVYYNSTRKLVLQGVDGVIFVADSSPGAMEANLESLRNLEENLNEYGKSLATMPHVVQFNKRDLPGALSVEELSKALNLHNAPVFEAVAATGQGVFPTLKGLASLVLKHIQTECSSGPRPSMAQTGFHPAPRVAPAPAAAAGEPAPVRSSEPAPARPSGGLELAPRAEPARAPAPAAAAASLGTTNMTPRSAVPSAALPNAAAAPAAAPSAAPVATAAPTPAGTSAAQLMRQQSAARPKVQAAPAAVPVAAPAPAPVAAPRTGARRAPRAGAAPAESSWKSNLFVVAAAAVGAGVAAAILKFI